MHSTMKKPIALTAIAASLFGLLFLSIAFLVGACRPKGLFRSTIHVTILCLQVVERIEEFSAAVTLYLLARSRSGSER